MLRVWLTTRKERLSSKRIGSYGFSLVEVLLAITIFGFLASGLIGALVYGRASSASAGDHARAYSLAEEGLQATRNIAAASYGNLVAGTYGLAQSGGQWIFSGSSDVSGIYTRQIVIAAAGTNRQGITSTVTWSQPGGTTGSVVLTDRLVNWPAALKSWSNAIQAGGAAVTGNKNGQAVSTQGKYAYTVLFTNLANNFVVSDISNPASPVQVSSIALPSSEKPTSIFVSGNYAYITCLTGTATLVIVNISNPASPTQVGSYTPSGTADGASIFVSGTTAYFGRKANSGSAEFSILNVSNPASPTLIGSYGPNTSILGVYVSGNYAYLAASNTSNGLIVLNITTPSSPTVAKLFKLPNSLGGAAITGMINNDLLLGSGTALYTVNVATPASPVVAGTFTAAGSITSVGYDITQQFAFLASSATSFQVVNISNLASPTLTKTVTLTSSISGISYDTSYDIVMGASTSTTQEIAVFTRN